MAMENGGGKDGLDREKREIVIYNRGGEAVCDVFYPYQAYGY